MELSIPVNKIDTRNVYFMEKKKNVIVDGDFVKILYSTAEFEMNGLYIFAEFAKNAFLCESGVQGLIRNEITQEKKCQNWTRIQSKQSATLHQKKYIVFNPSSFENAGLIELLCQIERSIIERYIQQNCPNKIASYMLKTQMANGIIKYHSENKLVEFGQFPQRSKTEVTSVGIEGLSIQTVETTSVVHLSRRENACDDELSFFCKTTDRVILKISGVWETTTHVGITMKFISSN
jgi:hypothetical protein